MLSPYVSRPTEQVVAVTALNIATPFSVLSRDGKRWHVVVHVQKDVFGDIMFMGTNKTAVVRRTKPQQKVRISRGL